MSQTGVQTLMGCAVVAGFVILRQGLRGTGRWDVSSWFIFGVAIAMTVPSATAAVMGTRVVHPDPVSREIRILNPESVDVLNRDALYFIAAVALAVAVVRATTVRTRLAAPGILAFLLWTLSVIAAWRIGDPTSTGQQLALGFAILAVSVLRPSKSVFVALGAYGIVLGVVSAVAAMTAYPSTMLPCNYKCGPAGVLFAGATGNENALGLALAAAIPFVWLGFSARVRGWGVVYLLLLIWFTGSRTAIAAALGTAVLILVTRPSLDKIAVRRWPLVVSCLGLTAMMVMLPFSGLASSSLTGRGRLWQAARAYLGNSPVWGFGPSRWGHLFQEAGVGTSAGTYSVHNQFLDVLFVAGWVGASLFAMLVIALVARVKSAERPAVLLLLIPMLASGIAERTWSIGEADWMSFAYLGTLLAMPTVLSGSAEPAKAEGVETASELAS